VFADLTDSLMVLIDLIKNRFGFSSDYNYLKH